METIKVKLYSGTGKFKEEIEILKLSDKICGEGAYYVRKGTYSYSEDTKKCCNGEYMVRTKGRCYHIVCKKVIPEGFVPYELTSPERASAESQIEKLNLNSRDYILPTTIHGCWKVLRWQGFCFARKK